MSNNEIIENEEQNEYVEVETNSRSSKTPGFADKFRNWINTQNKVLVYCLGGALILGIGIAAYIYLYKNPREKEALAAIYPTENFFASDSFKQVLKDGPKLADKYSGTKAGNVASYMCGVSYLRTGDYKKALEYLKDVSFDGSVLPSAATGILGDAYIENKELDKGYEHYVKASKMTEMPGEAVRWLKKAGRVCEKKNDWKKALEHYEDIKKNYKEEISASDIDKYIARAKAQLGIY